MNFKNQKWKITIAALALISTVAIPSILMTHQTNQVKTVDACKNSWLTKWKGYSRLDSSLMPSSSQSMGDEINQQAEGIDDFSFTTKNVYVGCRYKTSIINVIRNFPVKTLIDFTNSVREHFIKISKYTGDFSEENRVACHFNLERDKLVLNFERYVLDKERLMFVQVVSSKHELYLSPESSEEHKGQYKVQAETYIKDEPTFYDSSYLSLTKIKHLYNNLMFLVPKYCLDAHVDLKALGISPPKQVKYH